MTRARAESEEGSYSGEFRFLRRNRRSLREDTRAMLSPCLTLVPPRVGRIPLTSRFFTTLVG